VQRPTLHNHRADRADRPPIRLRRTAPADLPALFEMQSDPESNQMAGTKPRTREVFFKVWDGHFVNPAINSRVIEIDGANGPEIVGGISCFQAVEGKDEAARDCVGYWIAKPHWGKGVASRALAMFLKEESRRPLHATTASSNLPSRHILEKSGFRFVGYRMGEETDRFLAREIADFVLE
jgi:RimJ/RimL family protein N-acetyltransferase